MKNKPILFQILCLLMFMEPLFKILSFKLSTGFAWQTIIENILQMEGLKNIFEFWILFPLGGLALIRIRKWSYLLFIAVQLYSLITILTYKSYQWPYISERPLISTIFVLILNLGLIFYFLLPDIRRPFFDKKERWWEPKTRYSCTIPCAINFGSDKAIFNCHIHNISQTGMFLSGPIELMLQNKISIDFKILDEYFSFKGEVVSRHSVDGIDGHGVKINLRGIKDYFAIRKLITHLKLNATRSHSQQHTA